MVGSERWYTILVCTDDVCPAWFRVSAAVVCCMMSATISRNHAMSQISVYVTIIISSKRKCIVYNTSILHTLSVQMTQIVRVTTQHYYCGALNVSLINSDGRNQIYIFEKTIYSRSSCNSSSSSSSTQGSCCTRRRLFGELSHLYCYWAPPKKDI